MKRLLALVALFLASPALSATFYVDCTAPDDRAPGDSPANAWKTIAKVNRSSFVPGDSILFNRGCTWREGLTPPSSGSAGDPITFGAYGTGAAPILDGSDIVPPGSPWSSAGSDMWTASVTTEPHVVFFDGVKGTHVASQANCTSDGDWYWAANVLFVHSATDPDTAYTSPGIEVGAFDAPLYVLNGRSYIICDGLHFRRGNGSVTDMLHIEGTHITIQNCEIDNGGSSGVGIYQNSGDVVIDSCNIHDNATNGIFVWKDLASAGHENVFRHNSIHNNHLVSTGGFAGGIYVWSSYCIVEYNNIYDNGNTTDMGIGIEFWDIDNSGYGQHNIARYNLVSGQISGYNDGTGINADDFSSNTEIYGNVCHSNDGPGIGVWRANNVKVYNNTCYGNSLDSSGTHTIFAEIAVGAFEDDLNDNVVIKNNIAQATQADTYAIYLDSHAYKASGLSITTNDWYASATNWYFWNASGGNNLARWDALTGVGTDLNSDPLITNAASGDFTLQRGSPCVDEGADLGPSFSTALMPGSSWPTNVMTGDQYKTGQWWEIGAYLFRDGGPSTPPLTPAPTATVRKHLPRR